MSRMVKRPKLHVGDTGEACSQLGFVAAALDEDRTMLGSMLEMFVFQELHRQTSWRPTPIDFFHFRDRDDFEEGVVLYDGSVTIPFGDGLYAVPLYALWGDVNKGVTESVVEDAALGWGRWRTARTSRRTCPPPSGAMTTRWCHCEEGRRQVRRHVKHGSLDAIISTGCRVNAHHGSQFRIWATHTLRDHLLRGDPLHERRLAKRGLGEIEHALLSAEWASA